MFQIVHVVDRQRAEPWRVIPEKLDRLHRRRVRAAVIGLGAVREPGIPFGYQIRFGGFGVLNGRRGILLPERDRAEQVLGVRYVSNDLAVAADCVRGLEAVVLLGHFLRRTHQDVLHMSIGLLVPRTERIFWGRRGRFLLSQGGTGRHQQTDHGQTDHHDSQNCSHRFPSCSGNTLAGRKSYAPAIIFVNKETPGAAGSGLPRTFEARGFCSPGLGIVSTLSTGKQPPSGPAPGVATGLKTLALLRSEWLSANGCRLTARYSYPEKSSQYYTIL